MLINVSEKPVFYMENGKTFGTLKGFVLHHMKLTFLYCKFQEKYVYLPIDEVILGEDAVMLKTNYNETMLSASIKPQVYTLKGRKIGELSSMELDENFQVTAIKTDDQWIKKKDILYMDHIIIVQSLEETTLETLSIEEEIISEKTHNPSQADRELTFINSDLALSMEEVDLKESSDLPETEENFVEIAPAIDETRIEEKERDSNLDPRYNYLLGKKLLENITIADKTFSKNITIDDALVQFALNNNAIVKVIMNSED